MNNEIFCIFNFAGRSVNVKDSAGTISQMICVDDIDKIADLCTEDKTTIHLIGEASKYLEGIKEEIENYSLSKYGYNKTEVKINE